MSEKVELKPCPFCGGKNIEFCTLGFYSMVCNVNKGGCGASSGYFSTVEKAIEAWNRRVSDED